MKDEDETVRAEEPSPVPTPPATSARAQDAGPEDPVRLADPVACLGPEGCEIQTGEWSGVTVYRCPSCGFETFDSAEAERRAGAGNVSLA